MEVEFFFDIVCPYAYLGSTQIARVAAKHDATVVWKPFLLGGVFRALGVPDDQAAVMSPAKQRNNLVDMQRWANHFGVPLRMPVSHPQRTVLALRAILATEQIEAAQRALYLAYWRDGDDITKEAVVASTLDRAGLDGSTAVRLAKTDAVKRELRSRTGEAVSRGVFGAPTMFVGDAMFWGQDRLHFVADALAKR